MMPATVLPATRPAPQAASPTMPASACWPALGSAAGLAVTDPALLPAARDLLAAEIAAVDAACSTFRDDSELSAVNAAARRGGGPVRISSLLAGAIAAARLAAEQTGGDVDPVAGPGLRGAPAISAAGHAEDAGPVAGPGSAYAVWPGRPADGPARLTVTTSASWRQLQLDTGRGLVTLPAGSWLDLGATAKAWAADRAATTIAARLGCGVLISLGGDVAASGEAPPGGWRVRVQDNAVRLAGWPELPATVVSIRGGGLATAGAGAARWRYGGEARTQLLRSRPGALAASPWRLASVTAASCLQARAASIAAIVRGDGAAGWLAGRGFPARLVNAAGQVRTVAAWPADLAESPGPPMIVAVYQGSGTNKPPRSRTAPITPAPASTDTGRTADVR